METVLHIDPNPNWRDLPFNIISVILSSLKDEPEMLLVCHDVCKRWRTVAKTFRLTFRRRDLPEKEAKKGNFTMVFWLVEVKKYPLNQFIVGLAARYGDLSALQRFHKNGCKFDEWIFSEAASNGDFKNMKWLRTAGCPWGASTFNEAVKHNNREMLCWLRKERCPWSEHTFEKAAIHGDVAMLAWLKREGCPWHNWVFTFGASNVNQPEVNDWLRTELVKPNVD